MQTENSSFSLSPFVCCRADRLSSEEMQRIKKNLSFFGICCNFFFRCCLFSFFFIMNNSHSMHFCTLCSFSSCCIYVNFQQIFDLTTFALFSLYIGSVGCLLIIIICVCTHNVCGLKKGKRWKKNMGWELLCLWRIINRMKGRIRRVNIVVIKSITSITHVRLRQKKILITKK